MTIEIAAALKAVEAFLTRLAADGVNGSVTIRVAGGKPRAVEYSGVIVVNTCKENKHGV